MLNAEMERVTIEFMLDSAAIERYALLAHPQAKVVTSAEEAFEGQ
jgi:hypothetical protein